MTWKKFNSLVTTSLIGMAVGCVFHYIWGTLIGLVVGIVIGTQTEEFKSKG